jgi:outer membrane murein-binding lipoprotein Lpp
MRRFPYQAALATVTLGVAAVLAGCGDSTDDGSSGTSSGGGSSSSTPAVCSEFTALKASIQQLRNVTIAKGASAEITSDLELIEKNLETLSRDAREQFSPQVDQLSGSLDALSSKVRTVLKDPNAANLSAVQAAARAVATDAQNLSSAVSTTC